jgi:hypothetical protein
VVDEISRIGARTINVIDNMIRSIKHIQNKFFGGFDFLVGFFEIPKMMLTP